MFRNIGWHCRKMIPEFMTPIAMLGVKREMRNVNHTLRTFVNVSVLTICRRCVQASAPMRSNAWLCLAWKRPTYLVGEI